MLICLNSFDDHDGKKIDQRVLNVVLQALSQFDHAHCVTMTVHESCGYSGSDTVVK